LINTISENTEKMLIMDRRSVNNDNRQQKI